MVRTSGEERKRQLEEALNLEVDRRKKRLRLKNT